MIRHNITYAFRLLRRNGTYSSLNILGLSIGLACFAMIGSWVIFELSFDRFHEKSERIYRIANRLTDETTVVDVAVTSPPLAPALLRDIPEIENAVRVDPVDNVIAVDDKRFLEDGIVADQSFFEIFDFKVLSGNRNTLLTEPYSIVLSKSLAHKYFGDDNPLGRSMRIYRFDPDGNGAEFKVTGIIEDRPDNTHFPSHFILSYGTAEAINPRLLEGWYNNTVYTYILIHPNSSLAAVQSKLPDLVEKYLASADEGKFKFSFFTQALTDIHLYSNLSYEIGANGSISFVIIFGSIGIIVLLLACINYINLSTAYATERFKEVGIHKAMGAAKRQLMVRYLTESWLLSLFSLLVAIGWVEMSRPLFEQLTGTSLVNLYTINNIGTLVGIASLAGLISGVYPAAILSGYKPASALKGQSVGASRTWLRKALVVAQFSVTTILVIGIVGVQLQMRFIQDQDLGFDKENLVVFGVHGSPEVYKGFDAFADDLMTNPSIAGVSRSNTTLTSGISTSIATAEDVNGKMANATVYGMRIDHDYLDVYKMKLLAGRNFLIGNAADSTQAFLVNEAAIRMFGYSNPEDAIGKPFNYDDRKGYIIGVVKDFNFHSLQHKIEPFYAFLLKRGFSRITIRINGDAKKGFDEITTTWKKHFPNSVIQYAFYEDTLAKQYRAESQFSNIFLVFSSISLVIACMGLFALVSYTVERRSKEIGIRKVLGATVSNILSMLSKEFLLLVAISSIVAIPVGYYFMNEWLTSFAYHVSLNAFMFVAAGALVLVVAWITVSLRTFRAASSNPVQSLRSE